MKKSSIKKIALSTIVGTTLVIASIGSAYAGSRVSIVSSFGFFGPPAFGRTVIIHRGFGPGFRRGFGPGFRHRQWRRRQHRQMRRMARHCFRHPHRC